ncbi:hypothetical protein YN1_7380 [Nanoarchaeota archaeon]
MIFDKINKYIEFLYLIRKYTANWFSILSIVFKRNVKNIKVILKDKHTLIL